MTTKENGPCLCGCLLLRWLESRERVEQLEEIDVSLASAKWICDCHFFQD